jgi:fatty acid desaturase
MSVGPSSSPSASATPAAPASAATRDAREICRGLFEPDAAVYRIDFLASALLGWGAFVVAVVATDPAYGIGAGVVSALALYRAVLFTHELTHAARYVRGFATLYDALIGVPLMAPSFMYQDVHTLHHRRTVYGTPGDPEYVPFAVLGPARALRYLAESFLIPIFLALRFAVFGPVSMLLGGATRRLVVSAASSLAINMDFRREPPSPRLKVRWWTTEIAAAAFAWTILGLVVFGVVPIDALVVWYLISVGVALINATRTLGAHRYANPGGELDVVGQLVDSVNVPGGWWTELWAPVGLRFHALHHMLPDLPYHALGRAHRRLIAELPKDAPYFETLAPSLFSALKRLFGAARAARETASLR